MNLPNIDTRKLEFLKLAKELTGETEILTLIKVAEHLEKYLIRNRENDIKDLAGI